MIMIHDYTIPCSMRETYMEFASFFVTNTEGASNNNFMEEFAIPFDYKGVTNIVFGLPAIHKEEDKIASDSMEEHIIPFEGCNFTYWLGLGQYFLDVIYLIKCYKCTQKLLYKGCNCG